MVVMLQQGDYDDRRAARLMVYLAVKILVHSLSRVSARDARQKSDANSLLKAPQISRLL